MVGGIVVAGFCLLLAFSYGGGKYVRLLPGTEMSSIAAGGEITTTLDFRSLEEQVGNIIYLAGGGSEEGGGGGNR